MRGAILSPFLGHPTAHNGSLSMRQNRRGGDAIEVEVEVEVEVRLHEAAGRANCDMMSICKSGV